MHITDRVNQIVATFQRGRDLGEQGLPLDELIAKLNETEPRYRSVAFEGASMGIAIEHNEEWANFLAKAKKHSTQVHIGLGWAIAEQPPESPKGGIDLTSTLTQIEPQMRSKVLDGYGYWHGLFRRRLTIRTQTIPSTITAECQPGFDEGVGRAIWYISKGEIEKLVMIIGHFPEERRADLWCGIGIAATYVGGCSEEHFSQLESSSDKYNSELEKGIELAERSMRRSRV